MFSWITKMEELVMNAWPALHTHLDDGWVIRFADQITHRALGERLPGIIRTDCSRTIQRTGVWPPHHGISFKLGQKKGRFSGVPASL